MTRLSTAKPRLGSMPSRLGRTADRMARGMRRSEGPINTARWQRLRLKILKRDGWICQITGARLVGGKNAPNSAVVDHIRPHRGDLDLFWDESNLRAVSKAWHDTHKQSLERRGLA
ncbi:HNH endonuclease [Thalassococcus sp. S3]|uniref:HNH endonuclease n=1 Tax=Thalassococcus sp. S3 TaxID=2017482 RepID=UPI001024322E|nr:HNH endonuclease signature motif containing protein [Thalassococcus sp. S3]QBF32156.1 endonuclease [Thalassococcus sp. S3]